MVIFQNNFGTLFFVGATLLSIGTARAAAPNLPDNALARFGRMPIPFHSVSNINASELSPDGKVLATMGRRSATVWDTATGQPLRHFFFDIQAWPGYQRGLAFSPDGKLLACGPSNQIVAVFDLSTGKEIRRFATEYEMFGFSFLRFAADGSALIVESNKEVTWLDVATGKVLRKLSGLRIKQLSPDDKVFADVDESNRQVHIGDAKTGKIRHSLPIAAMRDAMEKGVLFLPDGVTMAVVHHPGDPPTKFDFREVQFWDLTTGKRKEITWPLPKSNGREAYRLSLSQDAKVLYFPEKAKIRRFSLETNKELAPITFINAWMKEILPHPDGKNLVVVEYGGFFRWDLVKETQVPKDNEPVHWRDPTVSRNGRWLVLGPDRGTPELWDTASGQAKRIDYTPANGLMAFTPDGNLLAINGYDHVQVLRVPELTELKKIKMDAQHAALHVSPIGRHFALVDTGDLRLFDWETDKKIWSMKEISKAVFTPDGKKILVLLRNPYVLRLHDLATQKVIFEEKQPEDRGNSRRPWAGVTALAFSPTAPFLTVAMVGGHVFLLDSSTGKERFRFLSMPTDEDAGRGQHFMHATALAFSADGRWLAMGGTDGFVRVWEVSARKEVYRLHGHEWESKVLAFTENGRGLVSAVYGEGILWDLRPKQNGKKEADPFVDLLSDDGPKAYRAVWALIDDPLAPTMLGGKISAMRLDAGPDRITRLIADLDSQQFPVRNSSMRALGELEENARPALQEALKKKPALETQRRILKLLEQLDGEPNGPDLRIARAIQVLELQGSEAARKALQTWSEGTPGLRLTEGARAALARLRQKKTPIENPGTK